MLCSSAVQLNLALCDALATLKVTFADASLDDFRRPLSFCEVVLTSSFLRSVLFSHGRGDALAKYQKQKEAGHPLA